MTIPTDVESHAMGYKDHSSNPDIRPRRMSFVLDVEIHAMGYKDHYSHSSHYYEIRNNDCPRSFSTL
jgi:hypothetical protein